MKMETLQHWQNKFPLFVFVLDMQNGETSFRYCRVSLFEFVFNALARSSSRNLQTNHILFADQVQIYTSNIL